MADRQEIVLHDADLSAPRLSEQLPLRARLVATLPGPDRPDYVLAAAHEPIRFHYTTFELADLDVSVSRLHPAMHQVRDGTVTGVVSHVVLCARLVGDTIDAEMSRMPVNLAYVMDQTQLGDPRLNLNKILFAATLLATAAPAWAG